MKRFLLFWDVDTQQDFMRPEGKLYVPGAEKIISNLRRLTNWALTNHVLIVSSACAHHPGDEEFSQFPPHCLLGTPGQQKIAETRLPNALVIPAAPAPLPPGLDHYDQIIIEKRHFDVFTNPNIEELLSRLQIGERAAVVLYGVTTEICVACAARGLLERGYRVLLVHDAVCPLEEEKGAAAVEELRRRGAPTVATDTVLGLAA